MPDYLAFDEVNDFLGNISGVIRPKFFNWNAKSKNPSPVKETGFPLQLTLATPLPFLICEIRPEVLRPTLSGGLPFQVPSERSNKSIGRTAKTFRNIYDLALYRVRMSTAILIIW